MSISTTGSERVMGIGISYEELFSDNPSALLGIAVDQVPAGGPAPDEQMWRSLEEASYNLKRLADVLLGLSSNGLIRDPAESVQNCTLPVTMLWMGESSSGRRQSATSSAET